MKNTTLESANLARLLFCNDAYEATVGSSHGCYAKQPRAAEVARVQLNAI